MQKRINHSEVYCSDVTPTYQRSILDAAAWAAQVCISLILFVAGCDMPPSETESADLPEIETKADSVAFQLMEGLGGFEAWRELPYLRFDFAVESAEGDQNVVARHYWDRQTDDYRVEWYPGEDTTFVALFNVHDHQDGAVYHDGEELDENDLVENAYSRFINDSYWTLAPAKTFDEGVSREYVADSSDLQHDVIRLSFGDVGLTPGDQYWMYVNTDTGQLDRWAYVLERAPDNPPSYFAWQEYEQLNTPAGLVFVSTRKQSESAGHAILTPVYDLADSERQGLLEETEPRLE